MINLSTPNNILFKELMADKDKSFYWLKKKNGGDKSYEKMRDALLLKAKREKHNVISDVIEYRSANGNRWMTYECARYYKDADTSYTMPYAFCFYETLGSVGAFVPVKIGLTHEDGEDTIVIFTSHFFMQMSERLGLGYRSPEMVRAFHEFIPQFLLGTYKDEEDEYSTKLIVRLPGSIGWGFKREGEEQVFEVRTFLSDVQLNGKQRRITKILRERAAKVWHEPSVVEFERLKKKCDAGESIADDIQRTFEKYIALGVDEKYLEDTLNVSLWISTIFSRMGLAEAEDHAFWNRHTQTNREIVNEYVMNGNNDGEKFLELVAACAKADGFRKFDKEQARRIYEEEVDKVNKALQQTK